MDALRVISAGRATLPAAAGTEGGQGEGGGRGVSNRGVFGLSGYGE